MKAKRKSKISIFVIAAILIAAFLLNNTSYIKKEVKNTFQKEKTIATSKDSESFDIGSIPEYNGEPYVNIKTTYEKVDESDFNNNFYFLSELDSLGRCGAAKMIVTKDTLAKEKRGSIGHIKPSGWCQGKYEEIKSDYNPQGYLMNRCHLLAYSISGILDDERNLITGTRYFNVKGMLSFEEKILNYIEDNPCEKLYYEVTPIYDGNNLVASGVLMKCYDIDTLGREFSFCVYCYNVEPKITINYKTGENYLTQ